MPFIVIGGLGFFVCVAVAIMALGSACDSNSYSRSAFCGSLVACSVATESCSTDPRATTFAEDNCIIFWLGCIPYTTYVLFIAFLCLWGEARDSAVGESVAFWYPSLVEVSERSNEPSNLCCALRCALPGLGTMASILPLSSGLPFVLRAQAMSPLLIAMFVGLLASIFAGYKM